MSVRNALILCVVIEISLAALAVINFGWTLQGLQATARFSGRFSLFIFSILFLVNQPADAHSWLSPKPFLIFAIAHGIHLLELLSFIYLSQTPIIPYRIAGGFVAYLLIFAMPVLSYRMDKGQFNANHFKIAVIVFQYFVWGIFFLTYLPRVRGVLPNVGGSYIEYVVLLGWVSLMLGMKLPRVLFKRKRIPRSER